MAVTNSDTRSISVFSSALMFSCEPESTSCSMMLASRSRSNSAVVSARSILWVSIISLTVEVAVSFDCVIAFCAVSCRSFRVRVTELEAASPAVLITREISLLLSSIVRVKAKPFCSIDAIAWSVALVISLANCSPFSVMAESTPPLLSDSTVAISLVRWLTALAISSALPTTLRATSSLIPTSVRSASLALVRIASVVESASCAERALGFRRVDLDHLAELLHARIERIGGGLGAGLDLIGDGLGAADQQFLETADAAVEGVGDLERARAQGLVDLGRLGADRIRHLGAARVDGAGNFADALVERADDVPAAVGQGLGEAGHARAEHLLELREPLIERAAELAGAPAHALVERIDVIAHGLGHVLGALAEPLHQFAAIGLHGAVELGDVAGDQVAERGGVARDLLGQLGAAVVEHVLEGLQARRQHVLDRVAAVVERGHQGFGAVAEGVGHRVAAADDGVGDARAGLLQLGDHVASAQAEVEHQRVAGRAQRRVDLVGAGGDGFGHARAGVGDGVGELLASGRPSSRW